MSWQFIRLGDAATFVNGYAFKPSEWKDNGLEIIRIQNLTGSSVESNYYSGNLADKYKVRNGDLLISWSATLGIFEWDRDDAWLNQHIFKVVFDKHELDKNFFRHLIGQLLESMSREVHGSTMKHITKKRFDNMQIPLPPMEEQEKIAAILDAADELRQKDKALVAKYDDLTQSLFLDMFGDPVTNPKGWEKAETIKYCTCIVPGRDKPKSFTGDIPWVTTNDLIHLGFTRGSAGNIGLTKEEISFVRAKVIPKGSVIMTCVGDLGVISINEQEMVVNQQLHAFQCSAKIKNVFLMYNLSYQKPYMLKMASSTTVPYMNKTVANNTPTLCPPISLQEQFVGQVQTIESQKTIAQESLHKSETLFNSLLQKAFKGELTN